MDQVDLIDPHEGPITDEYAGRLYDRIAEHARRPSGGGCIACGPGWCWTRAHARGRLQLAGRPLDRPKLETAP